MKNIFENTKFGDKFKTRDNRIVRYCGKQGSMFELEHNGTVIDYFPDGSFFHNGESNYDIVSKCQEPINKEELIKKACKVYADLLSAHGYNPIDVNNEVVRMKKELEE